MRVVRSKEQSATRFYDVWTAAAVGNDGGQSQRHGFHQGDRTRFVGGGKREQVALQEFGGDVGGRTAKAQLGFQSALANLLAKFGGEGAGFWELERWPPDVALNFLLQGFWQQVDGFGQEVPFFPTDEATNSDKSDGAVLGAKTASFGQGKLQELVSVAGGDSADSAVLGVEAVVFCHVGGEDCCVQSFALGGPAIQAGLAGVVVVGKKRRTLCPLGKKHGDRQGASGVSVNHVVVFRLKQGQQFAGCGDCLPKQAPAVFGFCLRGAAVAIFERGLAGFFVGLVDPYGVLPAICGAGVLQVADDGKDASGIFALARQVQNLQGMFIRHKGTGFASTFRNT